ncbi:MAG TPA: hypothetical protein VMW29_01715 [Candidatus Bathyarchaeia archaeon]|nr:hypothetical protein [Candidatus Bathyarchaeia archaeon]
MEKKASPVWLIIFLCAIIVGFVWLVAKVRYQMTVSLLNQEIQKLTEEIEQTKKEKEELKEELFSVPASSSANLKQSPSAQVSPTQSATLEPKTATVSSER